MRFEGRRGNQRGDVRRSDFRRQTDIAAGNVSPTYGGQHGAGRFLDSARNDRGGALRQYLASFLRKEVAPLGDGG